MRGVFITFEGVEGSGKSTQARHLAAALARSGRVVRLTSEPDGTPLGVSIRNLFSSDAPGPTPTTEVFLFLAARQQHVTDVLRPALDRGEVVISDRYTDATLAYQGYGRGVDLRQIDVLNAVATGGLVPDLTVLLDVEAAVGMRRIADREHDAFERMGLAFHERVRRGYLEIAREHKDRVIVIAGDEDEAQIRGAIHAAVQDRLRDALR